MSEPKPFASLSPSLLARKGQARPAMRPQSYGGLDDLGWNDMGAGAALPPVVGRQPEIAEEFADRFDTRDASDRSMASAPVAPAAGTGKAAFTLRLNADRHLKLRIACALRRRSAQKIVTEALDAYLGNLPDIDAVAANFAATGMLERDTSQGVEK